MFLLDRTIINNIKVYRLFIIVKVYLKINYKFGGNVICEKIAF